MKAITLISRNTLHYINITKYTSVYTSLWDSASVALCQILLTLALLLNSGTMPSNSPTVDTWSPFSETFLLVHHPVECPPGPSIHCAAVSGPHSVWCLELKGKSYGFPSIMVKIMVFPVGEKLWVFPRWGWQFHPIGRGCRFWPVTVKA